MSQRPTVVAVIGSFNSGKSALINALLEQPGLLQEDILPCTNSLFWLRHHDVKEQHFDISLRGPEAIQRTTVAVGSRVELRLKLPQLLEFEFIDTAGTGDVEQPLAFDQVKEIVDLADIVIICWQLAGGLKADDRRMLDRLNLDRKRAVHVATHALHCGNGDMKQAQRKWNSLPEEFLTRFAGGHCVDLKTPKVAPEGWPWAFMSSPAGIWDDLRRMRRGGIASSSVGKSTSAMATAKLAGTQGRLRHQVNPAPAAAPVPAAPQPKVGSPGLSPLPSRKLLLWWPQAGDTTPCYTIEIDLVDLSAELQRYELSRQVAEWSAVQVRGPRDNLNSVALASCHFDSSPQSVYLLEFAESDLRCPERIMVGRALDGKWWAEVTDSGNKKQIWYTGYG